MKALLQRLDRTPAQPSQALCGACGLCCRGVWFSHVNLEPGEAEPAATAGLKLRTDAEGTSSFPQPCDLYCVDRCTAYDRWRPSACVNYQCKLLRQYTQGEVTLARAREHVAAAREMADRVQQEAGAVQGVISRGFMSQVLGDEGEGSAQRVDLSPGAALDVVALTLYFKKYFSNDEARDPVRDVTAGAAPPHPAD